MRRCQLELLFDVDPMKVQRFRCTGAAGRARQEEAAGAHEIVLPTEGVFLRRDHAGEVFGDVTQVLLFTRGQPFEVDHPSAQPDSCFILSPPESFLHMARLTHPGLASDDGDFRFRHGSLPLTHRDWLVIGDLFVNLRGDSFAAEEAVVTFLDWVGQKADEKNGKVDRTPIRNASTGRRRLVRDVRVYLNEHFCRTQRLNDISSALNTSTFHMCRSFRAETGQTINQYLTGLRLNRSLDLLADRDRSITEIAFSLGFASHSHFTSRFHHHFDVTPSVARRRLRSGIRRIGLE